MTDLSLPAVGPLAWIDVVVLIWIALTLASTAYVAWDAFTNNPELTVMKWGWVLMTRRESFSPPSWLRTASSSPRPHA